MIGRAGNCLRQAACPQEGRRGVAGWHEDAIGRTHVQVHMAVCRRAEAVQEGDSAEPRLGGRESVGGNRYACRSAQQSLDRGKKDLREVPNGRRPVGEKTLQPLRHGDHPLPHGHQRDDVIGEMGGGGAARETRRRKRSWAAGGWGSVSKLPYTMPPPARMRAGRVKCPRFESLHVHVMDSRRPREPVHPTRRRTRRAEAAASPSWSLGPPPSMRPNLVAKTLRNWPSGDKGPSDIHFRVDAYSAARQLEEVGARGLSQ